MAVIAALTLNPDFRIGTDGNDIFSSMPNVNMYGFLDNTLQSLDILNGGEGYDELFANLVGTYWGVVAPTLIDIEKITFKFSPISPWDAIDIDLGNAEDVTRINVIDSYAANVEISNAGDISKFKITDSELAMDVTDSTAAEATIALDNAEVELDMTDGSGGSDLETVHLKNLGDMGGIDLNNNLSDTSLQTVTIEGSGDLWVGLEQNNYNEIATLDASTFTGNLEIDVMNVDSYANFTTGTGDDSIYIADDIGEDATIKTQAGDDAIYADGIMSGAFIGTGGGADYISANTISGATINTGANEGSDDTIYAYNIGDDVNISMGGGEDTVWTQNLGEDSTIDTGSNYAGDGDDWVGIFEWYQDASVGQNSAILTGDGADDVIIGSWYGDDADVIVESGVTIDTGTGADYISVDSDGDDYSYDYDYYGYASANASSRAGTQVLENTAIDSGQGHDDIIIGSSDNSTAYAYTYDYFAYPYSSAYSTASSSSSTELGANGSIVTGKGMDDVDIYSESVNYAQSMNYDSVYDSDYWSAEAESSSEVATNASSSTQVDDGYVIDTGTLDDTVSISSYSSGGGYAYNRANADADGYYFAYSVTSAVSRVSADDEVNVGEGVLITTGDGDDDISIESESESDSTAYNYGDATASATYGAGTNEYASSIAQSDSSVNMADGVKVDAGSGDDTIDISSYAYAYSDAYAAYNYGGSSASSDASAEVILGNGVEIDMGAGSDEVYITASADSYAYATYNTAISSATVSIGDDFTLNTGGGIDLDSDGDIIVIAGENSTVIGQNLSIKTGKGDDDLSIGSNMNTTIGANADIRMQDGDDTVNIWSVGSDSVIDGGTGYDDIWIGEVGSGTIIYGGDGRDIITVDSGSVEVRGGKGGDTITGGSDNDILKGNAGADVIDGGYGSDEIFVGIDNALDTVVFSNQADSVYGDGDAVFQFEANEDKLDLSAVVNGTFAYVGEYNTEGELLAALSNTGNTEAGMVNGTLYVDVDGDGDLDGADMQVELDGVNSLTEDDFIVAS